MRRNNLFRTILILGLIVLALVYLYPTLQRTQLDGELNDRLEMISEATGISVEVLRQDIFRFDLDLVHMVRNDPTIPQDRKDEVIAEIQDLRENFYASYDQAQDGAIKLGLDLQGGMHLVLEVNLVELMVNTAKNKDATFDEISQEVFTTLEENPDADFEGVVMDAFSKREVPMARYFGDPRQSDREILRNLRTEAEDAVDLTLTKLRNRVDEFGVSEPSITKQGARRIVVELPGIQDPARARNLIGRTALLEFKLVADPELTAEVIQDIDKYLAEQLAEGDETLADASAITGEEDEGGEAAEDTASGDPTSTEDLFGDEGEGEEEVSKTQELMGGAEEDAAETDQDGLMNRENPFSSMMTLFNRNIAVPASDRVTVERYLGRADVKELIPPEYEFIWGHRLQEGREGEQFYQLYLVHERAELTGSSLSDAQVTIGSGSADPTQAGAAIVNLTMNREGARRFARVTENHVGEPLAIVLDDKVHMAPNIRTRIPDGRAIIEGSESVEEANDLAIVLRAGALPAPVEIIEERTVGPSLGADSIQAGTLSALIGLGLVMIFMIIYYRFSGIIADSVLLLNIIFLMAVLAGFGFTLTLPGIAGIILTIGMAVDANVLIFERIREELRAGKSVWNAVKNGFDRARLTILDANVTTFIAGVVLYQFGTGPIRGFALTLMIGIVASVFTALVVSRAVFDWITGRTTLKKLSI